MSRRSSRGAGTIVLVFVLAMFVIGVLGVFGFEWTRVNVAQQELQHVCEASALAAAAAMPTPYPFMNPNVWFGTTNEAANDAAEQAAQQIFISNSIQQIWLTNTQFSDNRTSTAQQAYGFQPGPNAAAMYIEFLAYDGSVQQWTDRMSTQVHVIGTFGLVPLFGRYCGIGKMVIVGDARAPIPWVHTFHSDWTWEGAGNTDISDNGEWQVGALWNLTSPGASVQGGMLYVPENPGGFLSTGGPTGNKVGNSGFRERYGYFQAVAKLNFNSWGKFWLSNWQKQAQMPQIDVVDSYGGVNTTYYGILHQSVGAGDVTNQPKSINTSIDLSADYHTYGVMWIPNNPNIYFMLDGQVVLKSPKFPNTDSDQLQLAIGDSPDTVFDTSTGAEPPAQFKSVDVWEFTPQWPENVSNCPD